jgi:transposase
MPQQRMDIRMIKDILRLKYQGNLSHERIALSLGVSKGAVAKYLTLASGAGLDWASTAELDEASLERGLMGSGAALSRAVEPDYARVHVELRRKGVTLMLLWGEYRAAHEGQRTWAYTQFCGHYKAFAKTLKRSMRLQRRAGEKLFIDYAGPTLELADGSRGQVFVAAMGASSYTFACATADQRTHFPRVSHAASDGKLSQGVVGEIETSARRGDSVALLLRRCQLQYPMVE